MTQRVASLLLCIGLAACATPPQPSASLPEDSFIGAGDPTRAAIIGTAWAFGGTERLAGQPAAAAEAVANLSYLAAEIPTAPRWRQFSPIIGVQLRQGEAEARAALGIPPNAPPQAVIDALLAARTALRAGDMPGAEAALPAGVFPDGGRLVIARLGALPAMPAATAGTRGAVVEMNRDDASADWPD
ncbi:hypothetical protein ACQW02_04710 [Humitalea sp. 24SJ18S-53]|uniref:hypothetical protein n=1 Tax=Humitalea sp. 24SJ18S-53 TaxID=3422307 RepID=UPI003D67507F